jgi:hypothetical protein
MTNAFTIGMKLPLSEIDHKVFEHIPGATKAESLSIFLSDENAKAGGQAVIAVDDTTAQVEWSVPEISLTNQTDIQQLSYVGHLIQCGLCTDPTPIIAQMAYNGGLFSLAMNLLSMNSTGKSTYVAERDAKILTLVAPKSVHALSMCGLILLENSKTEEASLNFAAAQAIDPLDLLSSKYMAISLTVSLPKNAVVFAERAIAILATKGVVPDAHLRTTYGMALLSAKMKTEAEIQFLLACGHKKPSMSPSEWVNGGYRIIEAEIPMALAPKVKAKVIKKT